MIRGSKDKKLRKKLMSLPVQWDVANVKKSDGERLLRLLPDHLRKKVMKYAVKKFNWWTFTGDWRVGEYFVADAPNGCDVGLHMSYDVGAIGGHIVYQDKTVQVLTRWVMRNADQEDTWHHVPIFLDVKSAWAYDPDKMREYMILHVLKIRSMAWHDRIDWWTGKYQFGFNSCPGSLNVRVPAFYTTHPVWPFLVSVYYSEYVGDSTLTEMSKRREWFKFGKHMLSTYKLLFEPTFMGRKPHYDKDLFGDYETHIYGVPIMEYRAYNGGEPYDPVFEENLLKAFGKA